MCSQLDDPTTWASCPWTEYHPFLLEDVRCGKDTGTETFCPDHQPLFLRQMAEEAGIATAEHRAECETGNCGLCEELDAKYDALVALANPVARFSAAKKVYIPIHTARTGPDDNFVSALR